MADQAKKSLPKRASSTKLKEARKRRWINQQAAKKVRRDQQDARYRANEKLIEAYVGAGNEPPRTKTQRRKLLDELTGRKPKG